MGKTRFIGDIHGKFRPYLEIIGSCERSIQVGDFGIGFADDNFNSEHVDEMLGKVEGDHRWCRGNHDNPAEAAAAMTNIPDGHVETTELGNKVMYIGGSWSIDWMWRRPGESWWEDEELSVAQLSDLVDKYEEEQPDILVTHTAPYSIPFGHMHGFNPVGECRTEKALQIMIDIHAPKINIFGHWHQSFDKVIDGTRFICLNELEFIDLEI